MKRRRPSHVVVLGAGPVGLMAALEISKSHHTTLITRKLPNADDTPRVEAVPAPLLALLAEFGIHPRQIGIEGFHELRRIAWEQEAMVESLGPAAAHVDRPILDLALLNAVTACGRVNIVVNRDRQCLNAVLEAARRNDVWLIDATGRASVSAGRRIGPARPWVARTFVAPRRSCPECPELRIAALPGGFVYRLGSSRHVILGIAGRSKTITGDPLRLERQLFECGAGWILEGLPGMAELIPGSCSVASVQWTGEGVGCRVGDAALARDTLSSQGLAAGISDALHCAASVRSQGDAALLSVRQAEQRTAHLRSLEHVVASCRFKKERIWSEYAGFVSEHVDPEAVESKIALKTGRLMKHDVFPSSQANRPIP